MRLVAETECLNTSSFIVIPLPAAGSAVYFWREGACDLCKDAPVLLVTINGPGFYSTSMDWMHWHILAVAFEAQTTLTNVVPISHHLSHLEHFVWMVAIGCNVLWMFCSSYSSQIKAWWRNGMGDVLFGSCTQNISITSTAPMKHNTPAVAAAAGKVRMHTKPVTKGRIKWHHLRQRTRAVKHANDVFPK